jgi:hypothetical protein
MNAVHSENWIWLDAANGRLAEKCEDRQKGGLKNHKDDAVQTVSRNAQDTACKV